jgi:hypothetical protein
MKQLDIEKLKFINLFCLLLIIFLQNSFLIFFSNKNLFLLNNRAVLGGQVPTPLHIALGQLDVHPQGQHLELNPEPILENKKKNLNENGFKQVPILQNYRGLKVTIK